MLAKWKRCGAPGAATSSASRPTPTPSTASVKQALEWKQWRRSRSASPSTRAWGRPGTRNNARAETANFPASPALSLGSSRTRTLSPVSKGTRCCGRRSISERCSSAGTQPRSTKAPKARTPVTSAGTRSQDRARAAISASERRNVRESFGERSLMRHTRASPCSKAAPRGISERCSSPVDPSPSSTKTP